MQNSINISEVFWRIGKVTSISKIVYLWIHRGTTNDFKDFIAFWKSLLLNWLIKRQSMPVRKCKELYYSYAHLFIFKFWISINYYI